MQLLGSVKPSLGASIVRIGFLQGSLKGVYRGSTVRFYDIGALIIRIGFWDPFYYINKINGLPKLVLAIM